jgi:hypothetical protein
VTGGLDPKTKKRVLPFRQDPLLSFPEWSWNYAMTSVVATVLAILLSGDKLCSTKRQAAIPAGFVGQNLASEYLGWHE